LSKTNMLWVVKILCLIILPPFPVVLFGEESEWASLTLVTPTKMPTAILDSPLSTTVIDGDLAHKLGLRSLEDSMRLAPGYIIQEVPGLTNLSYHGQNVNYTNRSQFLFNSIPFQRAGYSGIGYGQIPMRMSDVFQIEVVRGTSAADYGRDAFLSAVNIISKDPNEYEYEVDGYLTLESSDIVESNVGYVVNNDTSRLRIRYDSYQSSGLQSTSSYEDDSKNESLLLRSIMDISYDTTLSFTALASSSKYETPYGLVSGDSVADALDFGYSLFKPGVTEVESIHLGAEIETSWMQGESDHVLNMFINYTEYDRRQELAVCAPSFIMDSALAKLDRSPNIKLAISDVPNALLSSFKTGIAVLDKSIISPLTASDHELLAEFGSNMKKAGVFGALREVCGTSNYDILENQYIAEGTHVYSSESLNMSTSISYEKDLAESETYYGGQVSVESLRLTNSTRYRFNENWLTNISTMVYQSDLTRNELDTSYRLSLNYQPGDNWGFRLLNAVSKRSPDIYITNRNWFYHVDYNEGVIDHEGKSSGDTFHLAESPNDLDSIRADINEVGVTYISNHKKTIFDLKIFNEKLSQLISEPFDYTDFSLTNDSEVSLTGMEFEFRRNQGFLKYGAVYAYIDNETNQQWEKTLYYRHTGSIYGVVVLYPSITLGLAYYGNSGGSTISYNRYDLTLTYEKDSLKQDSSIFVQFNIRHYPKEVESYVNLNAVEPYRRSYASNVRGSLTLGFKF